MQRVILRSSVALLAVAALLLPYAAEGWREKGSKEGPSIHAPERIDPPSPSNPRTNSPKDDLTFQPSFSDRSVEPESGSPKGKVRRSDGEERTPLANSQSSSGDQNPQANDSIQKEPTFDVRRDDATSLEEREGARKEESPRQEEERGPRKPPFLHPRSTYPWRAISLRDPSWDLLVGRTLDVGWSRAEGLLNSLLSNGERGGSASLPIPLCREKGDRPEGALIFDRSFLELLFDAFWPLPETLLRSSLHLSLGWGTGLLPCKGG